MQIIKSGLLKYYTTECPECNTVFKFSRNETLLGLDSLKEYIHCPLCREFLYFHDMEKQENTEQISKKSFFKFKEKKYKSVCSSCEQELVITDKDFKFWIFGLYYRCPDCQTSILKRNFELCLN